MASPYFFKPLKCEFKELEAGDGLETPPVVTLSVADNFKTLKFHEEPLPGRERLMTIAQVLSVENTFECLEYLPHRPYYGIHTSYYRFNLSAPALNFLSRTLPLLSTMVIDLGHFDGYSTSWDQAYRKAKRKRPSDPYVPLPYKDGLDVICAIARFQNLRHLTLHFKLQDDQIVLVHPKTGYEAVREVFDSIQRRKQGQNLVRLQVVFCADSDDLFGRYSYIGPPTVSTTMTVVCSNTSISQSDEQSQWAYHCDNPRYGMVIERRKRAYRLYGEAAWMFRLGGVQQNLLQGKYTTFPWSMVMESLMCLALSPSYLVFEVGKRVRFEPSLASVEIKCHKDWYNMFRRG